MNTEYTVETSSLDRESIQIKSPIFLVGAVRSGTTLLRLMLDHHPRIAFQHEFELAVERVGPDGAWPDLSDYHHWLKLHRGFHHSGYRIDPKLTYPQLVNHFLYQKQAASGHKPLVGATVHENFDRLRFIWPDARYIHLVRDGRDVARSVVAKGWAGNVYYGADRWLEAEHRWDHLIEHIDPTRWIEVYYEDLVRQPEDTLTTICDFLDVPYDANMLRYSESAPQYPLPDPKMTQQWRRKLSISQLRLVESKLRNMLQRRDYELSETQPLKISPLRRLTLKLHNRLRRARNRVQSYGLMHVIIRALARRLKLEKLHEKCIRHENEVDEQNVQAEVLGLRSPSDSIAVRSAHTKKSSMGQ